MSRVNLFLEIVFYFLRFIIRLPDAVPPPSPPHRRTPFFPGKGWLLVLDARTGREGVVNFCKFIPPSFMLKEGEGGIHSGATFPTPLVLLSSLIGRLKSGKVEGCGRTGKKMKMYLSVFTRVTFLEIIVVVTVNLYVPRL